MPVSLRALLNPPAAFGGTGTRGKRHARKKARVARWSGGPSLEALD
ncbi:hypothetical protein [Sinosporangium siamense]|nr:hypothetical protein [Sinosporangium siamense]